MTPEEIKEIKRAFCSDGVHLSLVPKPGGACIFIGKWEDWIKFICYLSDTKKIKWSANYQGGYPREIGVEMAPDQQEHWDYTPLDFIDYQLCGRRYQRLIVDASIDSQIFSEIVAPLFGFWLASWEADAENVLFFINEDEDDNEIRFPVFEVKK